MGLVLGRALFCGVVTHISSPFKKTCLCELLNLCCSSAMILWHSASKSFSYCIAVSEFNCYGSRDRYCCFHFQKKNQEKHCRSLSCVFPLIYLFCQSCVCSVDTFAYIFSDVHFVSSMSYVFSQVIYGITPKCAHTFYFSPAMWHL